MREIRSSGSVEGVMSNHDSYSDFSRACGRYATTVYSGRGVDIVMQSGGYWESLLRLTEKRNWSFK